MKKSALVPIIAFSFLAWSCASGSAPAGAVRTERGRASAAGAAWQEKRLAEITMGWERDGGSRTLRPDTLPGAVSAAWWLAEGQDDAGAIQGAIDSGAAVVVVPDIGRPWEPSRGIVLRTALDLIIEPGAAIVAGRGAFLDTTECLFSAERADAIRISGYGAVLGMRKRDYVILPYVPSQWRHAISLKAVRNCLIEGLSIENSGGDGIYLGTSRVEDELVPCERVVLADLGISGNLRQGISVISARSLRVDRCVVYGTSGAAPEAGIDFEPNTGAPGFEDCVISDCSFRGNNGPAVLFAYFRKIKRGAPFQSIVFRDCAFDDPPVAFAAQGFDDQTRGEIRFDRCRFRGLKLFRVDGAVEFAFGPSR